MKKLMLAVFVLLLSAAVFAQPGSGKKSSESGSMKNTKSATVVGCVEGSAGSYMLKKGKRDIPVTSAEDLGPHVGHKVKLTGSWEAGADKKAPKTFNATKVDMVAESCHAKKASTTTAKSSKKKS